MSASTAQREEHGAPAPALAPEVAQWDPAQSGGGTAVRCERSDDLGIIVSRAAGGDADAWNELVQRYSGLVWAITRRCGLRHADAAEVSQTTWLRLVEHLDRIEQPEAIGGWLATTARRESIRMSSRRAKETLVEDDETFQRIVRESTPTDARIVGAERDALLHAAFDTLPDRAKRLLSMLYQDPPPSYVEVSAALHMPIGSIGPSRARALVRLRHAAEGLGMSREDLPLG